MTDTTEIARVAAGLTSCSWTAISEGVSGFMSGTLSVRDHILREKSGG